MSLTTLHAKPEDHIQYGPVTLTPGETQILRRSLEGLHRRYDPEEALITRTLSGYNYHTDAQSGVMHELRGSFSYAVALLDLGDEAYTQRAFDILKKGMSLQDKDPASRTCGIWPYYMEEPLATKKSPADYNWADFIGVSLLEVWLGHEARIPDPVKAEIQQSLMLAARSIQKRNVGPGYTNIAIMGTYMTFMTAHLFDLPELKTYARDRLHRFYEYTLDKGGFSEYNSPTYTIVALDELLRMKQHIIDPGAVKEIDVLYRTGWDMIARHYHRPTAQWAGPHSRSYRSLVSADFYGILHQASNGRIDLGRAPGSRDIKKKHTLPESLLPCFLDPRYPRTEIDVFEKSVPQIIGTTYLTDRYALSTANRSSLWNQRRPFLAYWGSAELPQYLQVRFLHDDYDFSSASFYSAQKENHVLAAVNFNTGGGDKHISIDRIKDGTFKARNLRLRFEFGGGVSAESLTVPTSNLAPVAFVIDDLQFNLKLYQAVFDTWPGHWETGGDDKAAWIDYVVYTGPEITIDLNRIEEAIFGFTFSMGPAGESLPSLEPAVSIENHVMDVTWQALSLQVPINILTLPSHL
ncbi:MAG: hypothetical protein K9N55_08235 [Phycisphaerae bacterium]|nr:hypothetical protein [Phycisphaerae bacterium]